MHTPLGPGKEFDMIVRAWRALGDVQAPTGDDCTFLTVGKEKLAITADVAIEGTHFQRGWISMEEIGWRATTAAISDIAAVAGEPIGVMTSVGTDPEWPEDWLTELMTGVGEATRAVGAKVLGGDLVRSDRLVIDVCAIGRAPAPVTRGGAEVGDAIYVTGQLGGPASAIAAWESASEPEQTARDRFAHPQARVEEARWLKERGVKAMIDVSDGVLADAAHVAHASDVCCEIDTERVPVHAAATPEEALVSGEEFELLAVGPHGASDELVAAFRERFQLELTAIGRCASGQGVKLVRGGKSLPLPTGFGHF